MNVDIITRPFIELWVSLVEGLARLLPALLIFIIGLLIANLVYKAVVKLFAMAQLDSLVRPFTGAIERAGYRVRIGHIIGWLAKWFIIIATTILALDIMNLESGRDLLLGIVYYIPQVIIAILVLFVGFILADFVKKLIMGSTKMLNFRSAAMLGNIARIVIIVFAVLVALQTVGVASDLIYILFVGIVAMISLAGGLAFGLGGRDAAREAIEKAKRNLHR